VSAESLAMLVSMGFTDRQATAALSACEGSVERAADWLFSRADDLDAAVDTALDTQSASAGANADASNNVIDGPGEYELVGFVSHIGGNTACGHYVCHIKKVRCLPGWRTVFTVLVILAPFAHLQEDKWVIYNDEKVALSDNPPKDLGYLYLYQRAA
jgi:ubiquitin carboxyl-terminal hydrolase 5/13